MQIIDDYIKEKNITAKTLDVGNCLAYHIVKKDLMNFLSFLKTSKELRFTILTDLFATDFLNIEEKQSRFEIVYNLLSLELNMRLIIKIDVAENEKIESVSDIFKASPWYEREIYDMFGICFSGLQDHRRILTDYDFTGYPLRKDFPLCGNVQIRYDAQNEAIINEPVSLDFDLREFDFTSEWSGPDYNDKLPKKH